MSISYHIIHTHNPSHGCVDTQVIECEIKVNPTMCVLNESSPRCPHVTAHPGPGTVRGGVVQTGIHNGILK